MQRSSGHTLPELLFSAAIVAGLAAWTVPTFGDLRRNSIRTREVNQLVQAVHLARSEAIKRNRVISLCPSADGANCGPDGTRWDAGWITFVNVDQDSPASRDAGEDLLRAHAGWSTGRILSNRQTLSFRPFGQSGVTATFEYCDDRGGPDARAVIVSQTGRPRVSDRDASGQPIECQP